MTRILGKRLPRGNAEMRTSKKRPWGIIKRRVLIQHKSFEWFCLNPAQTGKINGESDLPKLSGILPSKELMDV
jgi:hypothetical protein